MRGAHANLHPVAAALLYSFEHARDDLAKWTEGLTQDQLTATHGDVASVAFQITHLAGSIDRLMTYAKGGQLNETQMAELKAEKQAFGTREELLSRLDSITREAEFFLRSIEPAALSEDRYIGRKRIPAQLGVLLIHIAEHTQRHVGEAIITCKIARGEGR